jgi:hypothetical protein
VTETHVRLGYAVRVHRLSGNTYLDHADCGAVHPIKRIVTEKDGPRCPICWPEKIRSGRGE